MYMYMILHVLATAVCVIFMQFIVGSRVEVILACGTDTQ